ncbi:MAG: hypothetical protein JWO48_1543, partial [Bryobacterales bacterium]|nr:hypothetical protein [Bryobacterales bacterium]
EVRRRIVAEAEKVTGGRVDIGAFNFDWHTLTARVNDLVIRGTEPAGSPPLLRARSITVVLKILSIWKRAVDLQSVDVDQPQTHLIIYPDGSTNVPQPKVSRTSKKTPVETILDLAIGRFSVQHGTVDVNSQRNPWAASGENLRAQFTYDMLRRAYGGDISIQPIHLTVSNSLPVDIGVKVSIALEKNKLTVSRALLETPQSNAELSGAVENFSSPVSSLQYNLQLSLAELSRTLRLRSRAEGTVFVGGSVSFRDFGHYLVTGNVHTNTFSFRQGRWQLRNIHAVSALRVDPDKIDLMGLRVSAFEGNFTGRAGIEKLDRFRLEGEASKFDLRRVVELSERQRVPWDGLLSGPVEVTGLLSELHRGRFIAHGRMTISPAPESEPVHGSVDANYNGFSRTLDLGNSFIQFPYSRLDFAGSLGRQLRVHLQSSKPDELLPALDILVSNAPQALPVKFENGVATFDGLVTGSLPSPQVAGHVTLTNFMYGKEKLDSFAADITAQKSGLTVENAMMARDALRAQFTASVALHDWKLETNDALSASGSVQGANVTDLLAFVGKPEIPAAGTLSASGRISGTMGTPLIKADVTVKNGTFFSEPFDHLTARVDYLNNLVTFGSGQINAGTKQLKFNTEYTHAPGEFDTGKLNFQASSNRIPLNEIHLVRQRQPSLTGTIELTTKGSAAISKDRSGHTTFQLTSFNADVTGQGIQVEDKSIGGVHLTAATQNSVLTAHLESAIANSNIRADGQWRLEGDNPGSAQVSFTKLDLAVLSAWLGPASPFKLAGAVEGKVTIEGPALKPDAWTVVADIPHLDITPLAGDIAGGSPQTIALHNSGPIRLMMKNSIVNVESARLTGQATNIALTGLISLKEKNPLDLRINGTVDLAVLEDFNADLVSSGKVLVDTSIRGNFAMPLVIGRMDLQNANLNLATFPNGLANATGVILFNGNRATIQNISGESGGGKITATGFASYISGEPTFRIEVAADQVRVRYPEGASTMADARLNWTGTLQRSLVSGAVTVLRTAFNPHTDFGSILAQSAEPVRTAASHTGLLAGMQFDVQIETSPDVLFESALAQQLQAEANLRLRGTATNPVLLGRINITQGELTFFGTKYTINQGSISFFNPVKLEPILNIDLETKTRGIDVTITISGPMNKLNVSYRSDPPLQFSDIVALLATGRAPTSDPSLLARETGAAQGWQQMGASALVGQAIANPVAGRLQRFFGVSRIKIDPQLTGVVNPQARLTLEQQVTPDLTFTYITNIARSNPQVIRIEWALNRQWSAVALREENGLFGLDFYYKKQFK